MRPPSVALWAYPRHGARRCASRFAMFTESSRAYPATAAPTRRRRALCDGHDPTPPRRLALEQAVVQDSSWRHLLVPVQRRRGARDDRSASREEAVITENGTGRQLESRSNTRMPWPLIHLALAGRRTHGLARILATVRPRRNVSPSSIQFIRMMLSTSELILMSPIMDDIPSSSGFSLL